MPLRLVASQFGSQPCGRSDFHFAGCGLGAKLTNEPVASTLASTLALLESTRLSLALPRRVLILLLSGLCSCEKGKAHMDVTSVCAFREAGGARVSVLRL